MSDPLIRLRLTRLGDFRWDPRTTVGPKMESTVVQMARRKEERLDNQQAQGSRESVMSSTAATSPAAVAPTAGRATAPRGPSAASPARMSPTGRTAAAGTSAA